MTVDQALVDVTLLYVETVPFIYFIEQHPAYLALVRAIFQHVQPEGMQVVTSTITLTEVLTMPIKMGQQRYQQEYREMLLNTEGVALRSVTASIAEQAAQLRARYGLKTPDALHLATALEAKCQAFLTNDLGLKRVKELNILVLGELRVR